MGCNRLKAGIIIIFHSSKNDTPIDSLNSFIIRMWTSWVLKRMAVKGTGAELLDTDLWLQSCPTLCDPIDSSPPGSAVPGTLQARTLEWVAISFSNAWRWTRSVLSDSERPHGLQPTGLLCPWDFPGKNTGVGCHRLLWWYNEEIHFQPWMQQWV